MKQLKLEVGKTYRSRKGEEVRIVEETGAKYPYRGDNDEWYAESGRYDYFTEDPEDLIEELSETRHTFVIPDGVKEITLDYFGNRIVVEMVPEDVEPKPGDVMINKNGSVYIFQSVWDDRRSHNHCVRLREDGHLSFGWCCTPGRPATPEEAQPLFDALKKAGKRWNAETMEVEEVPEFDRIREWVESHFLEGHYTQDNISEVIGHHLKQKEAKK